MLLLKDTVFLLIGLVVGGAVNMAIIHIGGLIIPPPDGVDVANIESIKLHIANYPPEQFLFPFLAHALGTLIAALIVSFAVKTNKMIFALISGAVFFAGGLAMTLMVPAPLWFVLTDLIFAYIPMALIAYWIVSKKLSK